VTVRRLSRDERVEQIERLEAQGLAPREIAQRLGLAVSTIRAYRADPEGERLRRRREDYRGSCRGCGARTSGGRGRASAPDWCARCSRERLRVWSEEQIVAAIGAWSELTGAPPTVGDWSPAHAPAGHLGSARYLEDPGRWPSAALVRQRFGSFRAAVAAAGFRPMALGPRPRWTRERIAAAVAEWQQRSGRPPTTGDWRHAGERHPSASTVYRVLGSWRRALEATGRRDA
jgi:Homing endonuclease associated repeat